MVKWLMRRGVAAFERQWNYDASYLHEMVEISPRAAWLVTVRMYPIVKYAMGHGKACTRIVVNGAPVAFNQTVAAAQR